MKDLDGLLEEMSKVKLQPKNLDVKENAVIFLFGRIFRFLNFDDIVIGHDEKGDLDAWARQGKNDKFTIIEFEAQSANFKKDKHDPEKCDLIVCWNDNWNDRPSKIDVFDLESLWDKAQEKT